MTLDLFVLIQYRSVTDGWTERQTNGRTDINATTIATLA